MSVSPARPKEKELLFAQFVRQNIEQKELRSFAIFGLTKYSAASAAGEKQTAAKKKKDDDDDVKTTTTFHHHWPQAPEKKTLLLQSRVRPPRPHPPIFCH